MCESEVKAAMPEIINGTAARTSFQGNQSYETFLFLECRIVKEISYSIYKPMGLYLGRYY